MNKVKIQKIMMAIREYGDLMAIAAQKDNGMSCKGYSHEAQRVVNKAEELLKDIETILKVVVGQEND